MEYDIQKIVLIFILFVFGVNGCKEGQKERKNQNGKNICCFPTTCAESHQFVLCTVDGGHDYCKKCPKGSYTADRIKTSEWDEQIDICVKKFMCNEIDTIEIEGECFCNKYKGYYGNDINNCHLDNQNCKEAGHELADNGSCVECDSEYFKPEDGAYGVCRAKTKCARHQVEAHPGSSKADRKCRRRTAKDPPPPTPPPTTDQTDLGSNGTRTDGDNNGFHHMYFWLVGVILSSLLILSVSAILIYVLRKKWCCAAFLKMFKVGRRYAPVPPVENSSDRGRSVTRSSREEDHELTSITNIDSSLDSSKSSSNSSKEHETACAKYRITEVIVELDENETSAKTVAIEPKPDEETVVKSISSEIVGGHINQAADISSTSLKTRLDEKEGKFDSETTGVKTIVIDSPLRSLSNEDRDISITKLKHNLRKDGSAESITKVKRLPMDDKDMSITKVKKRNEIESRTPKSTHKERGYLNKGKKGQSVDFSWPKFRKKSTQETSCSLPTTPKKSNLFGASAKESDRPTLKVEPFSRRNSPRNSQIESGSEIVSAVLDESFRTVPTGVSIPLFSDSIGMSHPLFSDSTGFYSCDDEGYMDPLNVAHLQQRRNRVTLPADVFVVEGDLGNGKDNNGRVRSLPIISQESTETRANRNMSYWQQIALHGLETGARSSDEGQTNQPSVHLSQRQNAIPYTSQSNEEVHTTSTGKSIMSAVSQAECAVIEPEEQISFDPLSTLDANSIMNETQVSITPSNPVISIPRPHEVLPPPEPMFDETMVAGPSSGSSEEAISEGGASEGAVSEGATSEGSGHSVVMPLLERKDEGSSSTGSGSSRKRTLSRSLSMEEENKDSSSSTEKSMG